MKVVIVGAGNVGYSIARSLSLEGHDIVVVERDLEVGSKVENELDVSVVIGNGSRPPVLEQAGIKSGCDVDFLVACTDRDEVNIMACWVGKRCGVKRVISRARGMEYTDTPQWATFLGIDVMNSPERSVARDIDDLLAVSAAVHATELFDGKAGSYAFRVGSDSPIVGMTLSEVGQEYPNLSAVMVYVERGNKGFVPSGDWVAMEGDLCFMVSFKDRVFHLQELFHPSSGKGLRRVMIVGGGKLGAHLARRLVRRYPGIDVKILDKNREKCDKLAEEMPRVTVLFGDGTDERLLLHEGIEDIDGFVATTDSDELNMILTVLADRMKARKTVAVVHKELYSRLAEDMPIDSVVNPNESLASLILRHVRYPETAGSLSLIDRIGAEMLEVTIPKDSPVVGKKLMDVGLPKGVLFAMVNRKGNIILPRGDMVIKGEDTVSIFATGDLLPRALRILGIQK
ncbi:TrkA-N domain protein [Dethiosulfovibrio peptidovorans DSM 11002]|uniref:Trk system potassium uptake protein TrkA n=1 Tax=Dethiosulfovibrio peptidovorans DSM 11002 TaxID=469381 RepID=D2Z682_9BACT|nr:Trk system potassium transporter TrkA [Dethiosulfovibrio peptidovorans]EFC90979.1 TrkA-N domain protein [Dethiosulfovibrio peptidovorans DSM 11002]